LNIQEYISSGIIESYVLGLASNEERGEFEQLCHQYPELHKARIAFERLIEEQAMQHSIQPAPALKKDIFEQIGLADQKDISEPAPVREMKAVKGGWMKWAAAACLVLLAGSLYWNYSLRKTNRSLYHEMISLSVKLDSIDQDISMIRQNPNIKMASMKGMEISPKSLATVYWDTTSKDVYLLINNLPSPPSEKQYQLWALLNGKPVDMGVIDMNQMYSNHSLFLYRMKNAQGAQGFAITLEKMGGNETPKGDMYVMGTL